VDTPEDDSARRARSVGIKSVRSLSESLHAHNHEARNRRTPSLCRTLVAARGCCRSCPPAPNRRTVGVVGCPGCISTSPLMACPRGAAAVTGPPSLVIGRRCRRPSRCRARATKHPSSSDARHAVQPPGLSNAPRARPASTAKTMHGAADAAHAAHNTTPRASHSPQGGSVAQPRLAV
jgi:hypothetical protein